MDPTHVLWVALLVAAVAVLYSSVGHGGASGYLAAMALLGMAPEQMKPTALALNIVVAAIATVRFAAAGYFRWRMFWPFAVVSVPMAFVGGALTLTDTSYRLVVGVVLVIAAGQLMWTAGQARDVATMRPPWLPFALVAGAGIGLLSGLTGVGGGIFLSPLLLLAGWAGVRDTAAVAAAFILVNSIAGLAGHYAAVAAIPSAIGLWVPIAAAGGLLGSHLGARGLHRPALRRLLALVLLIAGVKLMVG